MGAPGALLRPGIPQANSHWKRPTTLSSRLPRRAAGPKRRDTAVSFIFQLNWTYRVPIQAFFWLEWARTRTFSVAIGSGLCCDFGRTTELLTRKINL